MGIIVQKFGGVTVESTAKIKKVAERIKKQKDNGDQSLWSSGGNSNGSFLFKCIYL